MNEHPVCSIKAARIASTVATSPSEVARLTAAEATASMQSYFTQEPDPVIKVTTDEDTQEQNQDRIDSIKRSNPKAHGRHKPTRQGNS